MQDKINQRNETGQLHGPWIEYWGDGSLWYKGTYKNGLAHGSWKIYGLDDTIIFSGEYINDERVGLWKEFDGDGILDNIKFYAR
jgi:antitoxin component YwqK of YwqJK toxin-antitoxin module